MGTVMEIVIDRSSHFIQPANDMDAKKLSKIKHNYFSLPSERKNKSLIFLIKR